MSKKTSHAVEILPDGVIDTLYGSTKHTTCRVMRNGRNLAMPKVEQPNKTGGSADYLKKGSEKWRAMTENQKNYWQGIADNEDFWSRWTAFMSSFLLCVGTHGLEQTMNQDLTYHSSAVRLERCKRNNDCLKRRRRYKVDADYYPRTKATLAKYPVAYASELICVRLLDLLDVNNALRCRMIYRTDPVVEYEYFPEEVGDVEKGYYIKTERPRLGDELFQLIPEEAI